jgi:hypothetical protein
MFSCRHRRNLVVILLGRCEVLISKQYIFLDAGVLQTLEILETQRRYKSLQHWHKPT